MSVRLLTLKSTEDVIADVQEMIVDEKVVGYYLKYPCKVNLIADVAEQKGSTRLPSKIQLLPYMPMSKEKTIPVVADWVVTITEPVDQLLNMYIDGVNKYEAPEDFNTDEQSETSDAD